MNFEKFSAGQIQILKHVDRQNLNYSNENVRLDMSNMNENLLPDRGVSSIKYWRDVLENDVHVTRRSGKNATVDLCSFTISLPKELQNSSREEQINFFRETQNFICQRHYGGSDRFIISSKVHYDEVTADGHCTPHLHCVCVPAVQSDRYAGYDWKCSAKEFFDRQNARTWHDDYQKFLTDRGIDVRVKTGTTGGRSYTMDYYKKHRTEIQHERNLTQEIERKESRLRELGREQTRRYERNITW